MKKIYLSLSIACSFLFADCNTCLENCVSYVVNNYGYTQQEANTWCTTTPDASYGCADSCMDDMGDDGGEEE